jgi:hypothetical protein
MSQSARCKQCQSESCTVFPADVRVYLNGARTVSAPPINPAPTITMCLECGWSEFSVASSWLAARWLKPLKPEVYVPSYGTYSGD